MDLTLLDAAPRITPSRSLRLRRMLQVAPVALALVTSCVNPTNPFDADTPVELQARGSFAGVVRANVATDEGAEAPVIVGALVRLTQADGSILSDTSRESGAFIVNDIRSGNLRLTVSHPSYQTFTEDLGAFAPGEARTNVELYLTPYSAGDDTLALVTGTVLKEGEDSNRHGGVVVRDANTPELFGVTAQDGSVQLRLAPGTRELVVEEYGYERTQFEVEVDDSAVTTFATVTVPFVPGQVRGAVAVESPSVAGSISISLDRGGVDQVTADGSGDYYLPVVPLGTYTLNAFADGHDTVSIAGINVVPGEETAVDPIFLPRSTGTITGTARFAPGFDADNAGIIVSVTGTSAIASTDSNGTYVLNNVPTNTVAGYTLSFQAADFLNQSLSGILVQKNATTTVDTAVVLAKQIGDFEIVPAPYANSVDVVLKLAPIPVGAVSLRISESPDFAGVDYAPFPVDENGAIETDVPYAITGDDGQVTLYVQYRLNDDSEAGPFSSSIVLDRGAPLIESIVLDDGSGVTRGTSAVVTLTASDATTLPARYEISEDETFAQGSVIERSPYGFAKRLDFADAISDGPRTIFVRVFDQAGNVSAVGSQTIVRDTTAPTLNAFSVDCNGVQDAAICANTNVSLTIDATDAEEWFVSLSPDPQPDANDWKGFDEALSFSGLGLAQGTRTLYLVLRDRAGNVSAVFSDAIVIDTNPPAAASVLIDNGSAFIPAGRTSAALRLFALGASTMRISVDPDTTDDPSIAYAPTSTVTLPAPLVDGPFTVYVTFADAAGNEVTVSDSITIDTVPPTPGPLLIDGGAAYTAALSVTLSLDAIDAVEMQLRVDDTSTVQAPTVTDWVPFAATALALLPSGDCSAVDGACKQVCARFRDAAGNETSTQECGQIALDATAPAPILVTTAPSVTNVRAVSIVLTEQPADANFAAYEILVTPGQSILFPGNNGFVATAPVSTSPPTFSFSLPNVGGVVSPAHLNKTDYLVRLRAVDAAGNTGPEASVRIVYDEWAPTAPTLSSTNAILNADTFALLLSGPNNTADDDATFSNYQVGQMSCPGVLPNRNACDNATQPPAWTASAQTDGLLFTLAQGGAGCLSPCVNKLFVRAVDQAGNVGPPASLTIEEDSVAPSKPKMSPKVASSYGAAVAMRVDAAANDTTALTYEVRGGLLDNYAEYPTEAGGIVTFDLLPNEVNEVCLRARDAAGNVSVEECSVVDQAEQVQVLAEESISAMHLEDDYLSFILDRENFVVQDIRTNFGLNVANQLHSYSYPGTLEDFRIFRGTVDVWQGEVQVAFYAEAVFQTQRYGWTSVLKFPRNESLGAQQCGHPFAAETDCVTRYQHFNGGEAIYNLGEPTRIALGGNMLVSRLDRPAMETPFPAPAHVELVAQYLTDFNQTNIYPEVYLRSMPPGTDLCPGTEVVIHERTAPDVIPALIDVAWCETDDRDVGNVYRRTVTVDRVNRTFDDGTDELVGTTTIEIGDSFDAPQSFHQPVLTKAATIWVQAGALVALPHDVAAGNETVVDASLTGTLKRLTYTGGGNRLSMIRYSGVPGFSPAFVYVYDLDAPPSAALRQITNGVVTPYHAFVDGPRVMWNDRATLTSAAYFQYLGDVTWQVHGPQIKAFPQTDGRFTTFVDGRNAQANLYTYDAVERLERPYGQDFAVEGVGEYGQRTRAHHNAWVKAVGTSPRRFRIMTSDISDYSTTPAPECVVDPTLFNDAPTTVALADDATQLAYAVQTTIYFATRQTGCTWEPSTLAASGVDQTRDIDVIEVNGTPMVAWSGRLRDPNGDEDLVFVEHSARSFQLSENQDEGAEHLLLEGVELALVNGRPYFVSSYFTRNFGGIPEGEGPPAPSGIAYCEVAETGPRFCVNGQFSYVGNSAQGSLDRFSLADNGLIAAVEVNVGFVSQSQLSIIDVTTGRRRALFPAFYGEFLMRDPSVGDDPTRTDPVNTVVFSSTRLGAVDVWSADLLR